MRRSNGRGTEGKNEAVLVGDVGAKRKKRGVFSYGEVFFLLTCPLMGDPEYPFWSHVVDASTDKMQLKELDLELLAQQRGKGLLQPFVDVSGTSVHH